MFFIQRLFFFLFFLSSLTAAEPEKDSMGLTVDLRNPLFEEGVLTTTEGGVISGPDIRIQARKITYIKQLDAEEPIYRIEAEEDLILEFGEYVFVGSRLVYDFIEQRGILFDGRTAVEPWFFGGKEIVLHADGTFTLYHGFVTTSENVCMDWQITSEEATLKDQRFFKARNVQFRILKLPLLWIPSFSADLDIIFDSPIRYSFKWGGKQGSRISMTYEIFSWNRFKSFVRLDYRLKRGWGGGLETYYQSEDHRETLQTINYWARDNAVINPHEKHRFRFQGFYENLFWDDSVSLNLTWDKLSDKDMATDYNDRGLELDTSGRTQLFIRKQEPTWISHFRANVRLNQFQTVKQELPVFETILKPYALGDTGIISNSFFSASYIDFTYANNLIDVHDYNAPRVELQQSFYRPFRTKFFQLTPEAGFLGIYYGNSPGKKDRWLALGNFQLEAKTYFHRFYSCYKHVIAPYVRYQYITFPSVGPNHHYIFDIDDGWYRLDMLRFGAIQEFYCKGFQGVLMRPIRAEIFANAFFDTPSIGAVLPKAYADISYNSFSTLRHCFQFAWDFQHNVNDHFNFRNEWTVSRDLAIALEYRHRSAYDWRKADHTNFILESFRSNRQLFHSPLSDRRDTLLLHLFYQMHPNWALEVEARHGWNRKHEPSYTEFEVDFLGTLKSAWNVKVSYQHKEEDDRIAFYFSIGLNRPDYYKCRELTPCAGL